MMRHLPLEKTVLALLLACAGAANGQQLAAPQALEPAQRPAAQAMDAQETGLMAAETNDSVFRQWYAKQGRPAVVVYFDRQLDQVPSGWQGDSRLLIESVSRAGAKEESHSTTIGVQHNTERQAAWKSQFAKLFEQSLHQELKKQHVHVLDGVYLHRKLAASKTAQVADVEYESLSRSARFVFEVELVFMKGEYEIVANMKELRTGEITASVRQKAGSISNAADIDRLNRALVQRLMQYKVV